MKSEKDKERLVAKAVEGEKKAKTYSKERKGLEKTIKDLSKELDQARKAGSEDKGKKASTKAIKVAEGKAEGYREEVAQGAKAAGR
jgi:uncharacterized coiled-coil DUF342 family protein